jgi:L-threonylcarbamoyladenylate synthase
MLLRPGGITVEQLESVLGKIAVSSAVTEKLKDDEKAESPGMKYKHYAPKARVTIVKGDFEKYKSFMLAQKISACAVMTQTELSQLP